MQAAVESAAIRSDVDQDIGFPLVAGSSLDLSGEVACQNFPCLKKQVDELSGRLGHADEVIRHGTLFVIAVAGDVDVRGGDKDRSGRLKLVHEADVIWDNDRARGVVKGRRRLRARG